MNESKENNSNETHLSNDPIFVNDEIEIIHRKIFHLRRTNNEIRKFYSDDPDCIQALNENNIVIETNLNSLFIYFKLYKQLTQKQHFYTKLYESDLKIKNKLDKLNKHSQQRKPKRLKEFDLDYVAQRLREKTKELEMQKNTKFKQINQSNMKANIDDVSAKNDNENKSNNNDSDDFIADDDGGFIL